MDFAFRAIGLVRALTMTPALSGAPRRASRGLGAAIVGLLERSTTRSPAGKPRARVELVLVRVLLKIPPNAGS